MISFEYLPILPSEVPVKKIFTIGNGTYAFEFLYNSENDFYTVYISDLNDNLLYSTKIVYAQDLVDAVVEGLNIPYSIIPLNFQQFFTDIVLPYDKVNSENLDTAVRLYIYAPII